MNIQSFEFEFHQITEIGDHDLSVAKKGVIR